MKHFVGIDNSKDAHSVCILNENAQRVKEFEVQNNLAGFQKLDKELSGISHVTIGFELSFGPLVDYLRETPHAIISINPLKIKRYKESNLVSGNKTDQVDAHAIAGYLLINQGSLREMVFSSQEVETLKLLCISHDRLTKERTRHINRLISLFRQYFPLYDGLFTDSSSKTLLKMVIAYPVWADLQRESEQELRNFLKTCKFHNPKYVNRIISAVQSHSQSIAPAVEMGLSPEAVTIARILLNIKEEIANLEKKIQVIVNAHPLGSIFMSLPGAGIVLGSKMLALFGDNKTKFSNAAQAQRLFGTAPVNYQSGSYHKVIMRRACDKRARSIFYKFAFCSTQSSSWARAYYDSQRKKGKTHSVSVRALSNKWLSIIFSMWKNETKYALKEQITFAA